MLQSSQCDGFADPRFERLHEAFRDNFTHRGDVGAAIALAIDGELVVDLWGGVADPATGRRWEAETRPNIWSTTKGITAICFAILADRGLLDYDRPVADYWPEFAAENKQNVTVAMLLSHQAGLCGFREPISLDTYYDASSAAARLAAMRPFWLPGSSFGYHAISIGLLATALFQKVEGRSLKQFVAEELGSLGISIGLDPNDEPLRAAMLAPTALNSAAIVGEMTEAQVAALANPPLDPLIPNDPAWRSADIPSANGFATARGLAKLYGSLVGEGSNSRSVAIGTKAIAASTAPRASGTDLVLGLPAIWAAGFLRNSDGSYGPHSSAFGHSGWGGSFAFADPDRGWAFAYVMNQMGTQLIGDARNVALIDALYAN